MRWKRTMTAHLQWERVIKKLGKRSDLKMAVKIPHIANAPTVLQELIGAIDRKEGARKGWKSRILGRRAYI